MYNCNKRNKKRIGKQKGRPIRNRKSYVRRLDRKSRFMLTTSFQNNDLSDRCKCICAVSEAFTDVPGNPVLKYSFVANGMFDPFGTSSDAQPSWFKPWMALYGKYRVVGASIDLQCTNVGTASPYEICVYPSDDGTIVNSVVEANTQPFSTRKLIGMSSGMSIGYLKNTMVSKKMFGRSVMGDENFAADVTSNPPFKWYWHIFISTLDGTNVTPSFICKIYFHVFFYGRLSQGMTSPGLQGLWKELKLQLAKREASSFEEVKNVE